MAPQRIVPVWNQSLSFAVQLKQAVIELQTIARKILPQSPRRLSGN